MIVLLTDFGIKDPYVGIMKGVIRSISASVELIDLTHEVPPQNIEIGYFILRNSYKYFPKDTIFLVVIDPGVGTERKPVAIYSEGYFFVGPDNGIFSFLEQYECVELSNPNFYRIENPDSTFHGRDIFSPAAAHISTGVQLEKFGNKLKFLSSISLPALEKQDYKLFVPIIHIDHFGNLILILTQNDWIEFIKKNTFKIQIKNFIITKLSFNYRSQERLIALFNSYNLLELSVPSGSAKELIGAQVGDRVEVIINN